MSQEKLDVEVGERSHDLTRIRVAAVRIESAGLNTGYALRKLALFGIQRVTAPPLEESVIHRLSLRYSEIHSRR